VNIRPYNSAPPAAAVAFSKAWNIRRTVFPRLGTTLGLALLSLAAALPAEAQRHPRPTLPPPGPPAVQKPAEPAKPAPAEPAKPAEPAEFRALRAAYEAQAARLAEARDRAIRGELQRAAAKADEELQERTRVRNVRLMMIARNLKEAFEAVLAGYDAEKKLAWPEDIRRENEETFAATRAAVEAAAATADKAEAEFRAQALERFLALLKPEERPAEPEAAQTLFDRWRAAGAWPLPAETPAPAPGATPPGDSPPGTVVPGETPPPAPAEPLPEIFARSETDEPDDGWFTVARWTAEMAGPEMFDIPVFDRTGDETGSQFNPLTQRASTWKYEHIRGLPSGRFAFRLKRLEGRETVDVLRWPRSDTRGPLQIRTRVSVAFPSPTGFELLAAPMSGESGKPPAEAPPAAPGRVVEVQVTSEPPGAAIIVNGRVYREGDKVVRTPASIRLPAAERPTIRLRLAGHADFVAEQFRTDHLRSLHGRLILERDLPGKKVRVNPKELWEPAGEVRVNAGDRLILVPSGQWTIGSKGEPCGPEGYDRNDPKFKHYYEGGSAPTRQVQDANYGALLVRVGFPGGSIVPVGAETGITARVGGIVLFDVNEGSTPELRKDNRGSMEVKVIVIPKDTR